MNIKDLLKNIKGLTTYELEQKLNKLVRENYRYKNLDSGNRKVVMGLIKKYKKRLLDGMGISYDVVQREMYTLNRNKLKLKLTDEDLKDIKEILNALRQ